MIRRMQDACFRPWFWCDVCQRDGPWRDDIDHAEWCETHEMGRGGAT